MRCQSGHKSRPADFMATYQVQSVFTIVENSKGSGDCKIFCLSIYLSVQKTVWYPNLVLRMWCSCSGSAPCLVPPPRGRISITLCHKYWTVSSHVVLLFLFCPLPRPSSSHNRISITPSVINIISLCSL